MQESTKMVLKLAGFIKEIGLVEAGICPCCRKTINKNDFKDKAAKLEHEFTGMCQDCIDGAFVTNRRKQNEKVYST